MQTIVIGHRNPDMDSICAAIGYADLKRRLGDTTVVAGRAGATNQRIDYVLSKFRVDLPLLVNDLHPRVSDVMEHDVISINARASVYEAVQLIERNRMRGLPVVDSDGCCLGLLSTYKVLQHLFPPVEESDSTRLVSASLAEIARTFGGKVVSGEPCAKVHGYTLFVGAMGVDSFRLHLERLSGGEAVVIVGDREEIQMAAIEGGVSALIVTGDLPVSDAVRVAAKGRGVVIISSPSDTAATTLLARGAVAVEEMLEKDYISFAPDTLLETAKQETAAASGQILFPVIEKGRLVGVLSKSDFIKPIARQLILVDHNELSQAVVGADKVPIIEVLDHHRLGGIATDSPILFWNNPVGSTSSIVTMSYRQHGIDIPPPIAGLLMAGLISDTLNLTSPTTTAADVEIMQHLSSVAGVDPTTLADEIFSVGSPLLTMKPEEAVCADCKEYNEEGHRFSVAQIEEITLTHYQAKEASLLEALDAHCKANGYFFAALLVTDINTKNSILLICGSEEYRKTIDYPALGPNQWELNGVVSRKKQLLPYLLNCLQNMKLPVEA